MFSVLIFIVKLIFLVLVLNLLIICFFLMLKVFFYEIVMEIFNYESKKKGLIGEEIWILMMFEEIMIIECKIINLLVVVI